MNVMYNMNVCYAMYYNKILPVRWWEATLREKTLGEIWAAVIMTLTASSRQAWLPTGAPPEWGQSRSQYMARRGPWRTYSRGASRRPKPKYVHSQYMRVVCNEIHNFVTYVLAIINVHFSYNNRCLFLQVKNKPWIPWVYTWSWHRCEQYCTFKGIVRQKLRWVKSFFK